MLNKSIIYQVDNDWLPYKDISTIDIFILDIQDLSKIFYVGLVIDDIYTFSIILKF